MVWPWLDFGTNRTRLELSSRVIGSSWAGPSTAIGGSWTSLSSCFEAAAPLTPADKGTSRVNRDRDRSHLFRRNIRWLAGLLSGRWDQPLPADAFTAHNSR